MATLNERLRSVTQRVHATVGDEQAEVRRWLYTALGLGHWFECGAVLFFCVHPPLMFPRQAQAETEILRGKLASLQQRLGRHRKSARRRKKPAGKVASTHDDEAQDTLAPLAPSTLSAPKRLSRQNSHIELENAREEVRRCAAYYATSTAAGSSSHPADYDPLTPPPFAFKVIGRLSRRGSLSRRVSRDHSVALAEAAGGGDQAETSGMWRKRCGAECHA